MNNNNIDNGAGNQFAPNRYAARQEFAAMMYRYAMNMMGLTDTGQASQQWAQFTDRGQIADWAYQAMRWINFHGIITGRTTTLLAPTETLTRAEAAMIFMRFMNLGGGADIDALTRDGATWRELLDLGFNRVEIQGAFEREMIRLVNNLRRQYGLWEFTANDALGNIARLRAEESVRHESFTHRSETTGLEHTDHARAMGVNVYFAGENLSGGRMTVQGTLYGWLNSPLHRNFIFVGHHSAGDWVNFRNINQIGVGFDFNADHAEWNYTRFALWLSSDGMNPIW